MNELTEPILVTGAGGFIGSHLTEALMGKGYHVRAMVHYNFQNSWGWLEEVPGDRIEHPSRKTSLGVLYQALSGNGTLEVVAGDIQRNLGDVHKIIRFHFRVREQGAISTEL